MFDLLKKKLTDFVKSVEEKIKKKEETIEEDIEKDIKKETQNEMKAEVKRKEEERKEEEVVVKEKRREKKVVPSFITKIQGIILQEITIKENDIKNFLDDLEIQLLEADVALPVAKSITLELKERLVGKTTKYGELDNFVKNAISNSIRGIISQEKFDLISFIKGKEKPVKILFVGPNGHGKTTTIAKIAYLLKKNGFSCVFSASDTFRAAAIEQTVEHGKKIEVPVIKHNYSSDPTAVAFDATKYAEAHKIDVVLIDTAGRQETSKNLIEQLKKISRVIKPDLKIFVGEGLVGHAIIEQVSEFNSAIGLDGIILTKVDCDVKGGSVISIKKATGIPIFYFGTGQEYDALIPFDEEFILSKIMS